jgi:hypothetical protein
MQIQGLEIECTTQPPHHVAPKSLVQQLNLKPWVTNWTKKKNKLQEILKNMSKQYDSLYSKFHPYFLILQTLPVSLYFIFFFLLSLFLSHPLSCVCVFQINWKNILHNLITNNGNQETFLHKKKIYERKK